MKDNRPGGESPQRNGGAMEIPPIEEQKRFIEKMKELEKKGDKEAIEEALKKEFEKQPEKESKK